MMDGLPSKRDVYTAIDYQLCIQKIKERGLNFSMKRFLTAVLMVEKIEYTETTNTTEMELVDVKDVWCIRDNTLTIYQPNRSTTYHRNLEDVIVDVYAGELINDFDDNTHSTFKYLKLKALSITAMLSLILIPWGLSAFFYGMGQTVYTVLPAMISFLIGVFMIKPSYTLLTLFFNNRFLGIQKTLVKLLTKINTPINEKRESLMYTMAEAYAYDNGLSYAHIEKYISDNDLNKKSLMELIELSKET